MRARLRRAASFSAPDLGASALKRALALLVLALLGCASIEPYVWNMPEGFPPPSVPEDNPMSRAKVELGRQLFYDQRLSANGEQACASCHQPQHSFSDPRRQSVGSTGETTRRNALALVNVAYNTTLTWAHPGLTEIEQQLLIPLFGSDPVELGIAGSEQQVLARLRADPGYQRRFAAAFPTDKTAFSFANIVHALASFVRSLISFDTPFDRYAYLLDDEAISDAAKRGLGLFFSEKFECHHCHGGFNFTQSTTHVFGEVLEQPFHNTGLYNLGQRDDYPDTDQGLSELTGNPMDRGRFRAPTLRNIALTAPYMHDGSIASLSEVIDFYASGGRVITDGPKAGDGRRNRLKSQFVRGFQLSAEERSDLLAFLHALTDSAFVHRSAHQNPFSAKQALKQP